MSRLALKAAKNVTKRIAGQNRNLKVVPCTWIHYSDSSLQTPFYKWRVFREYGPRKTRKNNARAHKSLFEAIRFNLTFSTPVFCHVL